MAQYGAPQPQQYAAQPQYMAAPQPQYGAVGQQQYVAAPQPQYGSAPPAQPTVVVVNAGGGGGNVAPVDPGCMGCDKNRDPGCCCKLWFCPCVVHNYQEAGSCNCADFVVLICGWMFWGVAILRWASICLGGTNTALTVSEGDSFLSTGLIAGIVCATCWQPPRLRARSNMPGGGARRAGKTVAAVDGVDVEAEETDESDEFNGSLVKAPRRAEA